MRKVQITYMTPFYGACKYDFVAVRVAKKLFAY